ncbi:phage tail tape measure protein [Bacillus pseudomycoides]|uniref:Phage tail tape measure protein n=1 Tax=Bacillus bingmayongensis TaxID=1150157 RepID=A0ABU5JSG8_9BACI|nr:phage tail tape measure protein [Bacillus pseudomycoides]
MPGNKERNVVLNFKMDGQVQYANTLKQINMVMNNAAKEYKNHIAAMGQDATMTDKLAAEKKKLEIQMEAAKKRTSMLRAEYTAMSKDTNTTAEQLNKMYGKLLDAERAETSLNNAMKRVNEGLSEQAIEAREARGDMDKLQENTKKLEAEQKRLTSSFKLQNAELGANASEADRLELAQRQLSQQMQMTNRIVDNLERQLSAAKRVYGENSVEVQQLETKLNQARTTLRQFENSLQDVGRSGDQAADGMAEISRKLDLNNLMEASEILQGMSEKLIELGKAAAGIAIDFDSSQRKIQASLGLTSKGAENLQKIAVDTWKKGFGENLEEVDQALIQVYQNMRDVPHEELQGASENVLTLAKVYDVDLNEATRGAGQLMSQFNLTTQETFDLLATAAQDGLNYSNELFDNLSEYVPLFKQAGFTADEMFNILVNGTRDGSYNLDYINDLVKEFGIRVQDGSKGVSDAFGQLPEKTQAVWESFKNGKATAADVFKSVIDSLKEMDNQVDVNQIGTDIFGVKWEDMGAKAVLSLTELNGGLGDTKGNMEEMKKLQEESLGQQFQKALRETQAALEPIGQKLAELAQTILPPLVEGIKSVVDWFTNLSEPVQNFAFIFAGLMAVIGGLAPIIAAVVVSLGALGTSLGVVLLVIAGVSAAIAGVIWAIQNWGQITDWLSEKWSQFKDWFGELWSSIVQTCQDAWSSTVEFFSEAWASFLEMAHSFFDPFAQFFSDLWSGIVETASSWWSSLVETASTFFGQLKQAWEDTWNAILTFLDPIISLISTVLEAGWLLIQAGTQIAWAAISKYIIDPITEAYNWVSGKMGELVTWLGQKYEQIKSATLAAWNLVKKYIIDPVTQAYNWAKEKFGDLVNWTLKHWESIKSATLSAWNATKKYIIDPIRDAYNSVREKFNEMYNTAKEKFDSVKNAAQEKFDAAKRNIIDPIKEAVDKVKGFIDKIKGFFDGLKLKIPKPEMPKLPHFSLKTGSKTIMGKEISYPTGFDVDWRAKGAIFTRPTIFGMNNGRLQGAGEAGIEAALPLNEQNLSAIGKGIADTMGGTSGDITVHVYLDTEEVNTRLAPGMSKKINQNNRMSARSQGVIL